MDKKVFITRKIPGQGINLIKQNISHVDIFPHDRTITKQELLDVIENYNGLLCLLTDPVDRDVLLKGRNLQVVSNYAVGYNNIDIETATEQNIMVTNTPGVLTDATADLTWALILGTARKIIPADRFTRQGKFMGWEPSLFLGWPVAGQTLGIIGAGRIGTGAGLRAKGFSMNVLYTSNRINQVLENEVNAKKVNLGELLKKSDFISIHVPLTKDTKHLIGKHEFGLMKNSAVLINTSRGPVVDEKALVEALKNSKIAGAGLDVYENEPLLGKELKNLDNTLLLPHIGSATFTTRGKMSVMAAENLLKALNGQKPDNLVNQQVYGK
ncbi:D-glycerate dehydrogenase [candidate division KSB1 bacterium]|nr:MAG: D-glycerate dehydrogenase [candidate division KSB1 bacterium]